MPISTGQELIASVAQSGGQARLRQALETVREGDDLLALLAQYAEFDRTLAGSAADLAGRLYLARGFFTDGSEARRVLVDRGAEIASGVFGGGRRAFSGELYCWSPAATVQERSK
ncbi:MAG: hypothetical protein ACREDR_33640 [Blastocatellia bacterium]